MKIVKFFWVIALCSTAVCLYLMRAHGFSIAILVMNFIAIWLIGRYLEKQTQ